MSNTITTRRGSYGRLVMSYEGFNYLLDRQRCYKKYWQCAESNCNGRAVTYRNQFEQLTSSHTCKRKKVINKPRVINFDDLSDVGGPGTSNQMAFCTKINEHDTGMVLLTGNSHPELANLLAEKRGISLYDATVINKANKETAFDIRQSVRGKHVFILQTANKNVNNNVMEMLIWIYACKTSIAKTITVVLPYMPYSKQCRMFRLSSLLMKLVADMICKAGASCVVSLDLYFKEIQGFFGIPVDNLRASPFLLHYILGNIPDYKDAVIVAKNTGVMNKATSYIDRLKLGIAVIHGEQKVEGERGRKDGRQSPPTASLGVTYEFLPPNIPKDKPPLTIVGDVSNKIVIIVDDIIDDAFSFVAVAEVLKARGAKKIYVVATHWLLSHDAPSLLEASPIDEV